MASLFSVTLASKSLFLSSNAVTLSFISVSKADTLSLKFSSSLEPTLSFMAVYFSNCELAVSRFFSRFSLSFTRAAFLVSSVSSSIAFCLSAIFFSILVILSLNDCKDFSFAALSLLAKAICLLYSVIWLVLSFICLLFSVFFSA